MDEKVAGYRKIFHHSTVDMDAANLYRGAAIGFTRPAGYTIAAVEIGNKSHRLSRNKPGRIVKIHEISRQLMSQYPRIFKKRLRPFESMQIGPANAYSPDTDDRLTWLQDRRLGLLIFKTAGSYANK